MTQEQTNRERWGYYYNQSAVLPFRFRNGTLEVLLITSRKGKRWIIPKGIVEPNLSPQISAAKEALEEAGIEGTVSQKQIGTYRYRKWGDVCTVLVFPMRVEKILVEWLESFRKREWLTLSEAEERLEEQAVRDIVTSLPNFLARNGSWL